MLALNVFMSKICSVDTIISTGIILLLSACQPPQENITRNQPPENTVLMFVKGDPGTLIRGARLNSKSPFKSSNISDLNDYSLVTLHQFVEKEKAQILNPNISNDEIKKENESKDITTSKKSNSDIYKVQVQSSDNGDWHLILFSGALQIRLSPDSEGRLQPVEGTSGQQSILIKTLHWSMTPDKKFLSLLIEINEENNGKNLITFYFEKKSTPVSILKTDKKYIYLGGPGNKLPWKNLANNTLTIGFCGDAADMPMAIKALSGWTKALKDRLTLKLEKRSSYPPFSDLNQHCIHYVDSYFYESRGNVAAYGVALTPRSIHKAQIIDSDIFMFREEFQKVVKHNMNADISSEQAKEWMRNKFVPALSHEIGHMLGLDHKFDGTPSVMSYEIKDIEPQSYDIEALHELYLIKVD